MSAAARKLAEPAVRPSTLAVFVARAEARAMLWQAGELTLHEAVDELQASAEASGLVAAIGDDEVQRIMAATFAAMRDDLPPSDEPIDESADDDSFAALCRAADGKARRKPADPRIERLRGPMADNVSLKRAYAELSRPPGVAESTLQAAEYIVREDDAERFRKWLDQHSTDERAAIQRHLGRQACRSRRSK